MSSDPRRVAAQVLQQIWEHKSFSKHALSAALDKSQMDERDKGLCTELVYGTLRWLPVIEVSVNRAMNRPNPKLPLDLKCHLYVAAYQLQHLEDSIPAYAVVSSAVNAIKKKRPGMAGFANAILRNLGSSPHLTGDIKALGLPDFLIESLPKDNRFEAALAMNARPQTWFRKPHPDPLHPVEREKHPFVPGAQLGAGDWVQDPASQVAGLLVDAKPGQYIIDACAAPGSKSRILKASVGESGRVVAVDQDPKRLKLVPAGIETQCGDFRAMQLEKADAVLLDAPCSGYGTLRRHPEIKLWRIFEDVRRLAELQRELLEKAASLVKPGGVLVYSVCSPLALEGTAQIERFLEAHPEFKRQNARDVLPWLPENAVSTLGEIHLWPHLHESDAFFAVRLTFALS